MMRIAIQQGVPLVLGRLARDRRGISALEFALALPILLLILGGILDYGRMLWYQAELTQALRSGMQYALKAPSDDYGILTTIRNSTDLYGQPGFLVNTPSRSCTCLSNFAISCSTGLCPSFLPKRQYVTLSARYSFTPVVGRIMGLIPDRAEASLVLRTQ